MEVHNQNHRFMLISFYVVHLPSTMAKVVFGCILFVHLLMLFKISLKALKKFQGRQTAWAKDKRIIFLAPIRCKG